MQLFFWNASYISSSLLAMLLPFLVITMIFQLLIIVNYILFGIFKQLLFDNLWQISNRKRNAHSEQSLFIKLYSFFTRYKRMILFIIRNSSPTAIAYVSLPVFSTICHWFLQQSKVAPRYIPNNPKLNRTPPMMSVHQCTPHNNLPHIINKEKRTEKILVSFRNQ